MSQFALNNHMRVVVKHTIQKYTGCSQFSNLLEHGSLWYVLECLANTLEAVRSLSLRAPGIACETTEICVRFIYFLINAQLYTTEFSVIRFSVMSMAAELVAVTREQPMKRAPRENGASLRAAFCKTHFSSNTQPCFSGIINIV